MKRLFIVLVVLAALAAPLAAQARLVPRPKLAPAASYVAQRPVKVMCETSQREWRRYTRRGTLAFFNPRTPNRVYLSPYICTRLLWILAGRSVDGFEYVLAIHALVHEGVHALGVRDEGETDCQALTLGADVAQRFFGLAAEEVAFFEEVARQIHDDAPPPYNVACAAPPPPATA